MKNKAICCLLLSSFLFMSCQDNTFQDIIFRPIDDPFQDVPVADSLSLEGTVYLSWESDECSDIYILQRSIDSASLNFTTVYEGTGTSYTDSNLTTDYRYVYRLNKTRGSKIFYGENYAYGFCSSLRADSFEDNNDEKSATVLDYDRICNLPCAKFITDSYSLIDEDWFSITIPPVRTAEIIVSQSGLVNSTAGSATALLVQVSGFSAQAVLQQTGIQISNPSTEIKTFYFKIYPNVSGLFGADEYLTSIEYTISLNRVYKYEL